VGARNSEINIPAAQTPPSQIYATRIKPTKASPCASRLGPGVCGAPCSTLFNVHHPGSSSSDRRRVGNTIPRYRHPPDEQTSERTLARPLGEVLPPSARGLSEATRRRTTRRSARSEIGQPLAHSPTGSHRTPSPSVRPVTRERSPKREVRCVCVCGWWSPRLGLARVPGQHPAIL
jgi:hypothetical protein